MEAPSINEQDPHQLPSNIKGAYGFRGNPVNKTQKLHLGIALIEKSHRPEDPLEVKKRQALEEL